MIDSLNRHARAIWLAVILLTIGGVAAATMLPVSLFPQINYPRVMIAIDAGDREPAQMAAEITRPVEIALRAVPGVSQVRSTTSRGSAEVGVSFPWGEDMVAATLASQAALSAILPQLPQGTQFQVRRSDPTIFPVLGIALTSKSLDPAALRQLAELKLRPLLTAVPGVAGVDILGSAPREFAVDVDPARLAALNLTLADVATALSSSNSVTGFGRIEDRHRLYLALVDNRTANVTDLAATPIKAAAGSGAGIATLGQIATITPSQAPAFNRTPRLRRMAAAGQQLRRGFDPGVQHVRADAALADNWRTLVPDQKAKHIEAGALRKRAEGSDGRIVIHISSIVDINASAQDPRSSLCSITSSSSPRSAG